MMITYYTTFIPRCERETGVNRTIIDLFNDSEDFGHLPDDHPLKCYMLCQLEAMDMIYPDVPKIDIVGVFDNLEPLKAEHQDIFIRMGMRCLRTKFPADVDRCEVAYSWNVCLKRGDIDVSTWKNV